ncbi:hypothetical protein J6V86_00860 [bacterium]|nr:hypothetical protein [bacterium]
MAPAAPFHAKEPSPHLEFFPNTKPFILVTKFLYHHKTTHPFKLWLPLHPTTTPHASALFSDQPRITEFTQLDSLLFPHPTKLKSALARLLIPHPIPA